MFYEGRIYIRRAKLALAKSARRWWLRLEGGRWEGPARSMGRCCFHAGVCVWRCVSVFRLARVVVCGCACVSCDPSCSSCLAWFQVTQPFGGASGEGQYHPAGLVGTLMGSTGSIDPENPEAVGIVPTERAAPQEHTVVLNGHNSVCLRCSAGLSTTVTDTPEKR